MQNLLSTIGRVVFALPFVVFGVFHLMKGDAMAGMVPVPGGVFWIYFTGLAMIAGAVGLITKILGKWAALGLALLLAIFVVFIHIPGLSNPQMQQMAMMGILKDTALCGAALSWAGFLAREEARAGSVATRAQVPA